MTLRLDSYPAATVIVTSSANDARRLARYLSILQELPRIRPGTAARGRAASQAIRAAELRGEPAWEESSDGVYQTRPDALVVQHGDDTVWILDDELAMMVKTELMVPPESDAWIADVIQDVADITVYMVQSDLGPGWAVTDIEPSTEKPARG